MPLSEAGLLRYLVDHGVIDSRLAVDGRVAFVPAARQNRNFLIRCADAPAFFVKQPSRERSAVPGGLLREAALGWLVATRQPFSDLQEFVPGHLLYDEARGILVSDAAPGLAPHRQQSLASGFPPEIGTAIGAALARVHRISKESAGPGGSLIAEEPPWVLGILEAQAHGGLPQNAGISFATSVIGRHPVFARSLKDLQAQWRPERLCHGDLKWDNCLIARNSDRAPRVWLVDWEIVSWGDPAWDSGSLVQDYAAQALLATQLPAQAPPEAAAAAAEEALAAIRPAVAAFWRAYAGEAHPDFLRRTVLFAGARILQTAIEALAVSGVVTPNIAALLQFSHDLLERPEGAASSFFGFR